MNTSIGLDAHAKPPAVIRDIYKKIQKLDISTLETEFDVHDQYQPHHENGIIALPEDLRHILLDFLEDGMPTPSNPDSLKRLDEGAKVFEVSSVPGLYIYPSLLPLEVQLHLLNKLLHRDLSNPDHKTNIHLHYNVPYPPPGLSYFSPSAKPLAFHPVDPGVHKPFNTAQFVNKKLRWMTLGGQYDWTTKTYPSTAPPSFPADIRGLVEKVFPMRAEAAIVNLYSPGDTLSLHRDVSEECDKPLVSISLGCEGIFIAGLEGKDADGRARIAVMRLRSGDAVLMSGESRYAWHGVPKVLAGTCPEWMRSWPGVGDGVQQDEEFAEWKGWMAGKRVNLNVRQMFD